jgi:hypothetical protein
MAMPSISQRDFFSICVNKAATGGGGEVIFFCG